ncbi:gastrokine-1-like [Bufo gargarizans]|uniref:gastrokine-1-like n=1 Tax=Bufo gargarizans TaxID=30331 RepID=UPI001CF365F0|nr:gastrokine-1-like [Bufo gargarizans]
MKLLIATILGVLLTQALGNDNININNSGNDGGSISQQVNINNQDHVANINHFNGWNSWDSVCDFGNGFAATRLYNKKICVVTKMTPSFPTLEKLSEIAKTKKVPTNTQLVTYTVNQTPVVHIEEYGQHIEALCRGIPAYTALEMPNVGGEFALCDTNSIITIFGISFCF